MIKYEIGNIHHVNGKQYLDAQLSENTVEKLIKARKEGNPSNGITVYKVDYSKSKIINRTYGMNQGKMKMPLVVQRVGFHFEIKSNLE